MGDFFVIENRRAYRPMTVARKLYSRGPVSSRYEGDRKRPALRSMTFPDIYISPPSANFRRHAPCEAVDAPAAGGASPTCHTNDSPFSCIASRALHKPTTHPPRSTGLPDAPRHEVHECTDACGLLAPAEVADVVAPVVGRQLIQTHHQLSGRHGVAADARR